MNFIDQLQEEWKNFNAYLKRVKQHNKSSREYADMQDFMKNTDFTSMRYAFYEIEKLENKDLYDRSFEGLMDWIADGRPK